MKGNCIFSHSTPDCNTVVEKQESKKLVTVNNNLLQAAAV